MSKIIPPMVSSSPPPMDDNLDEDDEDDEFGSFSTANLSYNLDVTQPSKTSTNGDWEGNVKHQYDLNTIHVLEEKIEGKTYNDVAHHNGTHSASEVLAETYSTEEDEEVVRDFPREIEEVPHGHEMQQDNTSQDSVASVATDSGLCSASQDSEGTSPLPTATGFMVSIPSTNNASQDESSSSDETLVTSKSSATNLGQQLTVPSSLEMQGDGTFDVGSITLSEHRYFLNDLDSIEQRLKDSKELTEENIEDQFPISISKKGINNSTGQDYCDVSDSQTVRDNILPSEPSASIFCNSVTDVKTNTDKTIADQLPKNALTSDNQGKFLTNYNSNALIPGSSEFNVGGEPSRHLSNKIQLGNIGLIADHIDKCDDESRGNIATNSKVPPVSETHESDDDFADFAFSDAPSLPVASTQGIKLNESFGSDDEFTDFAFSETPSLQVTASALPIKPNKSFGSDDEFADFTFSEAPTLPLATSPLAIKSNESFGSDDEFADFTCSVVVPSFRPLVPSEEKGWADESAVPLPTVSTDVNQVDDDFDDFETASFPSAAIPTVVDHGQLSSRLENVVTTLFPGPACVELVWSEPSRRMVDSNPVWGDLRDVDTSHALSYQWVSSSANKMLLSSLGIDTRNILFGSKWNVAVPRFAANLGISPLEPVRARSPPPLQPTREPMPKSTKLHPETSTSGGPEASVPDAQFDWNSSGLVNPLDCLEKDGHRTATSSHRTINNGQQLVTPTGRQGISAEALKVLESLPNLSFLRSKTLAFPPPGQALTH